MKNQKALKYILFLLPFLIFSHKLFMGVFFFEDVSFLHIPLRWFVHNALMHHRPFLYIWNYGFGLPIISEGQFGVFYPLKYIFIWFNNIHIGYTLEMLTTYFITYSGMFLFSKDMGLKKGAYIAAIFFTFSGPLTGRHPFMNMIEVFSLMPWIFFTTRRFFIKGQLRFAIFTTLLITLQIFAYHPQALYMSSTSLLIYILLEQESNFKLKNKLLFFVMVHILAIFIALPQIMPALSLLREKGMITLKKYRGGYHWMQKGGLNFLIHFPYFFFPRFQGFHMIIRRFLSIESITLSLSGILLADVSWKEQDKKLSIWKIMALISFSLMFVKYNPTYLILSKLPIIKNFRFHIRWVIPLAFSLSILAGKGAELLLKNPKLSKRTRSLFYFIIGFIALNYILARLALGKTFSQSDILTFSEWSNIVLFFLYAILLLLFLSRRFRIIGVLLPGIFLFEIYITTSRLFVTTSPKNLKKILYSYHPIKNTRYFREGISFPVTIYDSIKKYYYLPQTDTIRLINTYYRYYIGNLFIQDSDETGSPFTAPQLFSDFLLSSCYILNDTFSEKAREQFFKIFGINGIITTKPIKIHTFAISDSLFPFYIYKSEMNHNKYRFYAFKEIKPDFTFQDFTSTPYKWDSIIPIASNSQDIDSCHDKAHIQNMRFKSDTLFMDIESPCKKYLFIPYRYHRGIKVYLNGKNTPIIKGFGEFITIVIPKGHSLLKIFYRFPFMWTIYVSIFSFISLLFIAISCKNCTFKGKTL